jgi:Protein of Unknown function (DUF2784)
MSASWLYRFLADLVLVAHFAIVLFVIGGLVFIVLGNRFSWSWVNSLTFRVVHLASILFVVAESWLGSTCPLTTLEEFLRTTAGAPTYNTGFVQHWVQRLLFFNAPSWVFVLGYTAFGFLVVLAWWLFPPRFGRARNESST